MKVLIIEDDEVVSDFIAKGLREEGHSVEVAVDGDEGLYLAMSSSYDVLIVDRMLPRVDGLSVVRALRASKDPTPILILSALADVPERVKGLSTGADDYLIKPFAFSELSARVAVLARRANPTPAEDVELSVGDLLLDRLKREARRGEEAIPLKPREYQLLEYLMRHPGQVVTRTMLLEQVWEGNDRRGRERSRTQRSGRQGSGRQGSGTHGLMNMSMGINGQAMDMSVINERVGKGEWERWRVENDDGHHPFHVHGCSFLVVSQDGEPVAEDDAGWKDTVWVNNSTEFMVRFDYEATDEYPYMYHCHILEHEDMGMMGQFTVR